MIDYIRNHKLEELEIGMAVASGLGPVGLITRFNDSRERLALIARTPFIDTRWDFEIEWSLDDGTSFKLKHTLELAGMYTIEINSLKPQKLYPLKCKICSAPSRRIAKLILCSNDKCKSRKQFKRFLATFKLPEVITLSDRFIRCPICNETANAARTYKDKSQMFCPNAHIWTHASKQGDHLRKVVGSSTFIYTYNGYYFSRISGALL